MTKEKQTKDYSGTIFDDVFRTMAEKFPELFVALINEAFGTDYSDNVPYEELKNEHYAKSGKLITDALFKIDQKLYHLECQSKKDVRMVIRMFEYDVAIAIENASETNGLTEINFPDSCVIYIRNHASIGKEHFMIVNFPDGQQVKYAVPVRKVSDYSVDEIFEKRLLAFLPYFILRYESFVKSDSTNTRKTEQLLKEMQEIADRLEMCHKESESFQIDMLNLIQKINTYVIPDKNQIKRKVDEIMGGKVLQLKSEQLLAEGRAKGRSEGENLLGKLITYLIAHGLNDEVKLAAADEKARKEMYKKYGIDK